MPCAKARGMEAAEVLACSATVEITLASSMPSRWATPFNMRWFAWWGMNQSTSETAIPASAAAAVTVNYTASVSCGLEVANRFRRQGHGTLVVISSVAGERARADNYVYGSSKAGLDAFSQGLGDALVGEGVRVMVVRPGFVHTRMTAGLKAAPFSTTADEVGARIVRGLESGADIVWAPPVLRWVFLVMRHLPRVVWRRVSARS